jgi:hypothetical protein
MAKSDIICPKRQLINTLHQKPTLPNHIANQFANDFAKRAFGLGLANREPTGVCEHARKRILLNPY